MSFSGVQLLRGADCNAPLPIAPAGESGGVVLARVGTQWLLDTGRTWLRNAVYTRTATTSRSVLCNLSNKELLIVSPKCGFDFCRMTSNHRIDNSACMPRVQLSGVPVLSEAAVRHSASSNAKSKDVLGHTAKYSDC